MKPSTPPPPLRLLERPPHRPGPVAPRRHAPVPWWTTQGLRRAWLRLLQLH